MAILSDKPINNPQTPSLDDKYNEVPTEKFEERQEWGTPFLEPGYHRYWHDKAYEVYPTDWVTVNDVFTQDELGYVENIAAGLEEDIPRMGEALPNGDQPWRDVDFRKSKVKWIGMNPDTRWLFDKISWLIAQANKDFFNFDIWGHWETGIQYTIYDERGSHYDWHMDLGAGLSSIRKLSITILLNEPEVDFNGGDLEFKQAKENVAVPRVGNSAVVFPSYMLHRVAPVDAGVRKSLVFWCTGPPFR